MKKLNLTDPADWKKLTMNRLAEQGGNMSGMYQHYNSVGQLLSSLYPTYREMCRSFVNTIVAELKLDKVEDLLKVPLEYLALSTLTYMRCYIRARDPELLQQHGYSIVKCKQYWRINSIGSDEELFP